MQANKRLTPATSLTATAVYRNLNITTVAVALEKYQQVKEQLLIDCQMQWVLLSVLRKQLLVSYFIVLWIISLLGSCKVQDTNKTAVTLVLQLFMTHTCN